MDVRRISAAPSSAVPSPLAEPAPDKAIPGATGAAKWDGYKCQPDFVAPNGCKVAFYDFTDKEERARREAELKAKEAEEAAQVEAMVKAIEETSWKKSEVPTVTLRTGQEMPLLGLGTWKSDPGKVRDSVEVAIKLGYRHIDCAEVYENESEVGDALSKVFATGKITRGEVFVTSKLWNTDHAPDRVEKALRKSLAALQLEYLDLYLIHWPVTGNRGPTVQPPIADTWRAMESLVDKGLVRAIGVSNFSTAKLGALMEGARVMPAVNQVEHHPYCRQDALLEFCRGAGVHVTGYSPLGSPDSSSMFKREGPKLLDEPRLSEVAKAAGRTPAQCLLRWGLQRGLSVLAKSVTPTRIEANLNVTAWELSKEGMAALSSFSYQRRMVDGSFWLHPQGPYKTLEDLWDAPDLSGGGLPLPPPAGTSATSSEGEAAARAAAEGMPRAQLSSGGGEIPMVGLGTWKSEPGQVRAAVEAALRAGYRHVDCAEVYNNEGEVGGALHAVLSEGAVRREDIFVTSKLWNTDHAPDRVEKALRKSLAALQLEYLDLYLIHWPVTGNRGPTVQPPIADTWRAMESLVDKGLVRAIGVSNFSTAKLGALMEGARVMPAVNQVESHPYFRNEEVIAWCKARGVHVTAYSPLGSPDSSSVLRRKTQPPVLLQDPVVLEVAAAVGRTPAQCLIRWAVQRGTSTLPKSVSAARIAANLDVWSWELPPAEFERLSSLPTQVRMVDASFWLTPQGPYKTLEEFWDMDNPVGGNMP